MEEAEVVIEVRVLIVTMGSRLGADIGTKSMLMHPHHQA
jgi:hypothetical protein